MPAARRRGMLVGMAKPIAKLVALIKPKRRWAQFSLATLLVVVALLCVGLRLVVVPAENQRRAVVAIQALGGRVDYARIDQATEAFPRRFLRRWLLGDYFDAVRDVHLTRAQDTDAGLAHLRDLTGLQELHVDGTQVTDGRRNSFWPSISRCSIYSRRGTLRPRESRPFAPGIDPAADVA